MITSIAEENRSAQTTGVGEKPKARRKPSVAPQRAQAASKKGKSAKKAVLAKKAPKAKKATKTLEGSKTDQVLELLKRPGGVTAEELMKATGWQPHSVRGFLSGTIKKKMGLIMTSGKGEDGERRYLVKS